MHNFTSTIEGQEFRFLTMNVIRCQLFQVYTTYEGKEHRFHMQRDGEVFRITDERNCPAPFRDYVPVLSDVISQMWEQ